MKTKKGMQFVEPIRDIKKISQIKNMLKGAWEIRNLLLFELWINSALRISDLLSIKVVDLFDNEWKTRSYFDLKEAKTNKIHRVTITPKVEKTLLEYSQKYNNIIKNPNNYIFFHSKKNNKWSISIWRKMARIMINEWCRNVWLSGNYWWHTLRKTWGYQWRMKGLPIELIQNKLNHSNMAVTKRYLWITNDEIQEACMKLDL